MSRRRKENGLCQGQAEVPRTDKPGPGEAGAKRQTGGCFRVPEGTDFSFRQAYEDAVAGVASSVKISTAAHGSLGWVVERYLGSARYRGLSESRRRSLRGELDWLRRQAGDLPLVRFGVEHVEALMDMKEGHPPAANAVRKNMSMLFRFAAVPVKKGGLGLNVDNVAAFAEKRQERDGGYHTWTDAEMAHFSPSTARAPRRV